MRLNIAGLLGAALIMLGATTAGADVWVAHAGVLERRDGEGVIVTTIPFSASVEARLRQGAVDPSNGNVWIVHLQPEDWSATPIVRVLGVTPSGDEIWQRTETGTGFIEPSIAIDAGRHGIWVVRAVDPNNSSEMAALLFDQTTGNLLATVHGLSQARVRAVGPYGGVWVVVGRDYLRLDGTTEELDGYRIVDSEGPHHRTVPFQGDSNSFHGSVVAVDASDGSLYHDFTSFDGSTDEGEAHLVKRSAEGQELFRVRYDIGIYESISDIAIDPRDGSVYVTFGFYNGRIAHVSSLGADLGNAGYWQNVNSVAVDPESSAVWIGHMPRVDDDRAGIAPMILRKLDASLQTTLEVPFAGVVDVVGAASADASLEISLEIQPQNKRNEVDLIPRNGQVGVALLSSAAFDPLQVDVETVRFGTAGAIVLWYWTRDVNRDGVGDLVLTFKTQHTGIQCGDTAAELTAQTYDGVTVHGGGSLCTRCRKR